MSNNEQTRKAPKMRPTNSMQKCLENHPPLPIGDYLIYGGSCSDPKVTNADVYVGFDFSTKVMYPWNGAQSVYFPITDMQAPKDPAEFKKLIEWLSVQLIAQKLVHLGCIGGHGRTGLVLAALYCQMTGDKDAITYVRKNYCERAVESATQVEFLHAHFGINKVPGAKQAIHSPAPSSWRAAPAPHRTHTITKMEPAPAPAVVFTCEPTPNSPMALWTIDNARKPDKMGPQSKKGKD